MQGKAENAGGGPEALPTRLGVTLTAVFRGQRLGERDPFVVERFRVLLRLVAIQTVRSLLHVSAALVLLYDGRRLAAVAGCTPVGGLRELRTELLRGRIRTLGPDKRGAFGGPSAASNDLLGEQFAIAPRSSLRYLDCTTDPLKLHQGPGNRKSDKNRLG